MQTTAMNEPLFLAEMIWAALLVAEFCRALKNEAEDERASRLLIGAGLVLLAAVFTRYDGWIFASFAWLVAAAAMWRSKRWRGRAGGAFVLFTVMLAVAPLLWMAYNAKQFGDPLDFLRGPYSAKAIEERTTPPGAWHHPGWHSMKVAALYFLKAAELGAVPLRFANKLLVLTVLGTLTAIARWWSTSLAAMLLLWVPLPFYAYSVAYGSVPIFIPLWWPHSWYNTRYGMEMLPIFAVSIAFLTDWLFNLTRKLMPRVAPLILSAVVLLIVINSWAVARATPLVLQEAFANSRSRIPFEQALARTLFPLSVRTSGPILMYTSEHIGALQRAGIPLKRTINEGDYYQWASALRDPAGSASLVVAIDGDAVAKAVCGTSSRARSQDRDLLHRSAVREDLHFANLAGEQRQDSECYDFAIRFREAGGAIVIVHATAWTYAQLQQSGTDGANQRSRGEAADCRPLRRADRARPSPA